MNEIFDSSYDLWLVLVLGSSVLVPAALGFFQFKYRKARIASIICFAVALCIAVLSFGAFPCKYALLDSSLDIKCGIFVDYNVPYSEVIFAQKSSNPASAPAWSLDRVEITTKSGPVLISPKNREQFIELLLGRIKKP